MTGGARELDVRRAAIGGAFASAVVGLFALATAGPVGPVPVLVLALALVAAFLRLRGRVPAARPPASFWTGFATLAIALVVVPVHALASGSWLLGAVDLLVLLQANRLWSLRRDASAAGQVLILGILMLAAAAVLTIRLEFLVSVFLFCLAGTWTGVFRSLLDDEATGSDARVPWKVAGVALVAGLGVFALTLALFGALPRLQFQTFRGGVLLTEGVSGFGDEVTLGDIGGVKADHRPVMRVTLSTPVSEGDLYWRGMGLDEYGFDEKRQVWRWRISSLEETRIGPRRGWSLDARRAGMATFQIGPGRKGPTVSQNVVFEAIDVNVLFALPGLREIVADLPLVTTNRTGSIQFRARDFGRMRYEADSQPVEIVPEKLLASRAAIPEGDEGTYLQMPEHLREPLGKLAAELAGEGPDFRKVRRLETAMQGWEYDLQPRRGSHPDPVLEFLTETRTGWCEHYSSGMVLLLRSIGIPARMVNGYHGGEKNEFGGFFLVRRSDAHSWVEVPFEGTGWVTFDPTPGGGGAVRRKRAFESFWRAWDALRLLWTQRVVEYNLIDQFTMVRGAFRRTEDFASRLSAIASGASLTSLARPGGGALAMVLVGLVARRAWRRRGVPAPGAHARAVAEAEAWWKRVEAHFRRAGLTRHPGETAREFSRRAGRPEWADIYYVARFGVRALSEEERRAIETILLEIGWRTKPRGGKTPTRS